MDFKEYILTLVKCGHDLNNIGFLIIVKEELDLNQKVELMKECGLTPEAIRQVKDEYEEFGFANAKELLEVAE